MFTETSESYVWSSFNEAEPYMFSVGVMALPGHNTISLSAHDDSNPKDHRLTSTFMSPQAARIIAARLIAAADECEGK